MAEPAFLTRMRAVFSSARGNQFLLSGNIHDLVPGAGLDHDLATAWLDLTSFLGARLRSREHLVLRYHIGEGIRCREDDRRLIEQAWKRVGGGFAAASEAAARDPAAALQLLAACTRLPLERPLSIVIEHADLLFPAGDTAALGEADRRRLAIARDWLIDPAFLDHNGVLVLLTETTGALNAGLRALPTVAAIEIPLPETEERRRFLDHLWQRHPDARPAAAETAALVELSAGMTLRDLQSLVREHAWRGRHLDRSAILVEVNRLLRGRIGEHIEIVAPDHDLSAVRGNHALLAELDRQRRLIDDADPDLCPVGILAAGPNGAGKTFIFSAWAASCQRVVVGLHNLRGSYFGETDRIFQRVRQVLESLGKVVVLIDEADTQFAAPGPHSHETESRLFGALISMMGDPRNRGRIVWVLMTARPELLAPDLKRPGRAGLHLPVFDPRGAEHADFLAGVATAAGVAGEGWRSLLAACQDFSAADYAELERFCRIERRLGAEPGLDLLERVLHDHRPAHDSRQRSAQVAQAMAHCSRRSLLPD